MKISAVESLLQDEVISVFTSNLTTIPERACVVYKWMEADFDFYTRLAAELKIEPIILLLASIVDSEDSILSPNGKPCKKSFAELCELLLESELIKAMNPGRDMAEIVSRQCSEFIQMNEVNKMEQTYFNKFKYQEAKAFLKEKNAEAIKQFSTPSFTNTLYKLDNGEQWEESESHLEAPEDDYTLQRITVKPVDNSA